MAKGLSEIVVLRPTAVFLAFLTSQLPEEYVPSFKSLQIDNTAYLINKHSTREGTLFELERLYPKMFRYEISRWLGNKARNDVENNFLDFSCCFKLEFHSHLIFLDSSCNFGSQVLQLKPRAQLLQWLRQIAQRHDDLIEIINRVNLSHLTENSSLVVKRFDDLGEMKLFVRENYKSLFGKAMRRMSSDRILWPKIHSFEEFNRYFAIRIHTHLISYAA